MHGLTLSPHTFSAYFLSRTPPVAFSLAVEPRGAIGGWFGQCELEQKFFVVWIHGCLLSAFSFASAAAISSQEGARQM